MNCWVVGGGCPVARLQQAPDNNPTAPPLPPLTGPCSIQQSVGLLLQQMPQTRVLVVGILPRGTGSGKGGKLGTNDMSWPSHYTQGIAAINAQLKSVCGCSAQGIVGLLLSWMVWGRRGCCTARRMHGCLAWRIVITASPGLTQPPSPLPGRMPTRQTEWSSLTAAPSSSRATR